MILDTTFLIDLMEKDEAAMQRKELMDDSKETYRVSAPTIFELWSGISQSKTPIQEKSKVLAIISQLDSIKLNRQTAEKAGEIHGSLIKTGQTLEALDCMIAATAMHENESLLTRNTKHFTRVKGLRVESY